MWANRNNIRLCWAISLLGLATPLGAAAETAPALWVEPAATMPTAARTIADELLGTLIQQGRVKRLEGAESTRSPAPSVNEVKALIKLGIESFFSVDVDGARASLGAAYSALSSSPTLLSETRMERTLVEQAILVLARAHLHVGAEKDTFAAVDWLLKTYPDSHPSISDYPTRVVELVEEVRASHATHRGSLVWRTLDTDEPCDLLLNGERLVIHSPATLPQGHYHAQIRCAREHGWVRAIEITHRQSTTLLSAPVAESKIDRRATGLVRRADLRRDQLVSTLESLSRALGQPVATATVEEDAETRRRRVVLRQYGGDGSTGELAWAPLDPPPAEEVRVHVIGQPAEATPEPPTETGRVWAWIALGTGTALVSTGAVFHVIHNDRVQAVNDRPTADDIETAEGRRTGAIILYSTGGAAIAASTVLFLLDSTGLRDSAGFSIGPSAVVFTQTF